MTPVVLISGQLLTADLWREQIGALAAFAPRVADNSAHDCVAAFADDVLGAAPPRFSLVGQAMGGFIVFEILRRAPHRVEKVVLISTLASADTPRQTKRRMGYLRLVEAGAFDKVIEERLPILFHPDRRRDEALVNRARKMAADTGPRAFLRQQRAIMSRPDSRPGLGAIAVPTLILCGRQDGVVTLADQEEMRAAIPKARLEVIEDCGHLMSLERPSAVTSALLAAL